MQALADLVEHLVQYSGRDNTRDTSVMCRRAAQNAITTFAQKHDWNWFRTGLTITLSQDYATGRIVYRSLPRTVTLTGGIWPDWAAYGCININNRWYEVYSRDSDSVLTLSATSAPPESTIITGLPYRLRRYGYQLPSNFQKIRSATLQPDMVSLRFDLTTLPPSQYVSNEVGLKFGIARDPRSADAQVLYVGGSVNKANVVQVLYTRKIPLLRYDQVIDGLITCSGTSVTGYSTKWESGMVGCIFRASANDTDVPTGFYGNNPYAFESLITSFGSAESISVQDSLTQTTKVKAAVSSPVDVPAGPMWEFLLREAEKQFRAVARVVPYNAEENRNYAQAYVEARESDAMFQGLTNVDYSAFQPISVSGTTSVIT